MAGLIPYNYRRNYLIPRNPFNMMDDFFSDVWPFGRNQLSGSFKVDVQESEGAYTIEAEMPGVRKEEINLSLDEGRLTIGVERTEDLRDENDGYIHRERQYSSMRRSIYMAEADGEGADANLNDGVLKIVIPKKAKLKTDKKIEIN